MPKRITIKNIADAAGVSVATVSYILNHTPGKSISEQTRSRVLAAVKELQYVPNTSAQRLKTNQTKCIAVRLDNNLSMPRYHNILQGIRCQLSPKGYSVLLTSYDQQGSLAGCVKACMSGQADGIIYIDADGIAIPPDTMEQIHEQNIPVATIDCMASESEVSSVGYDYYSSSRDRMDILIKSGYRKFVYLRPAYHNFKESAREQGVRSVQMERDDISIQVYNLPCLDEAWLHRMYHNGITTFEPEVFQLLQEFVRTQPDDTAILGYSRELQEMVSRLLYIQAIRNGNEAEYPWKKRSISYYFPHQEAGQAAAKAMLNMLDGDKKPQKASIHPILYYPDIEEF